MDKSERVLWNFLRLKMLLDSEALIIVLTLETIFLRIMPQNVCFLRAKAYWQ